MTFSNSKIHKAAFLINLDRRQDRLMDFQANSIKLDIPVQRFSAVDALDLDVKKLRVPGSIAACWMSHQEVAKVFLASTARYCLVLEDDITFTKNSIKSLTKIWESDLTGIDLLQIGFCVHSNRLANRNNYRLQVAVVSMLNKLNLLDLDFVGKFLNRIYGYTFSKLHQLNMPVANMTFELGTHAYIISREFAETIIKFNVPAHLPADLAMMELAETCKYNSYRLASNLINQSNSQSSISNSSINSLEKAISEYELKHDD